MQKGDAFAFGADPRDLIHERHTGGTTFLECSIEIVHGEAYVVNAGTALLHESRDRRIGTLGFEQLDESVSGLKPGDSRAVAVREGNFLHSEHVTK